MNLEGQIQVRLQRTLGRVSAVDIRSSRPDVAQALLQGRTVTEVLRAVPQLFGICAQSQTAACGLALAAAKGAATSEQQARAQAATATEMHRETATQALLHWPAALGEAPDAAARAAARRLHLGTGAGLAPAPGLKSTAGPATGPAMAPPAVPPTKNTVPDGATPAADLDICLLGLPAADWLALGSLDALDRWLDQGATLPARWLRHLRDHDTAAAQVPPALLPAQPGLGLLTAWGQALVADPGFARQPVWQGAPAETGALQRWQHEPLVRALLQRSASRIPARVLARLHEWAALHTGRWQPQAGSLALSPGVGLAWVDNARGLLVHRIARADTRNADAAGGDDEALVQDYRILAPTEWNFHPAGALALGLRHAPAHDAAQLQRLARALVHSLDPCVACQVELIDA